MNSTLIWFLAYENGAKYILVFETNKNYTAGILEEELFTFPVMYCLSAGHSVPSKYAKSLIHPTIVGSVFSFRSLTAG